jgi:hypothetical protein
MTSPKLYQYYETQAVLPTFGNFESTEDLGRYAEGRRRLFTDKLALPPEWFRDIDLLEFGPDSGENSITFALWGANLTLVEPNPKAWAPLRAYFERFGLGGRLREIAQVDVEGFQADRAYDAIDAEGFVYTIQPSSLWLRKFRDLLKPEGFAVISYYERDGALLELCLRAIHAAAKAVLQRPPVEVARALFSAKWDSIPHTRKFESWVMDVLENPFVRRRCALFASELCKEAHASGFAVHASWPVYQDPLMMRWHKKQVPVTEELAASLAHLRRSRLSFVAGRKLYLVGDGVSVDRAGHAIDSILQRIDAMIDDPLGPNAPAAAAELAKLDGLVDSIPLLCDNPGVIDEFRASIGALRRIFDAIARREIDAVAAITRSDPAFIGAWGQPTHVLAMRRLPT